VDTSVIVNGSSGKGWPADWGDQLRARFAASGVPADVKLLPTGPQIIEAAQQALQGGARRIVAGGGDGTVSAVASVLAGTGVALGVLPLGTLNHFAKDLRIPLELDEAIVVIAHGRMTEVDMGEVNGRLFINNSSLGLYPNIVLDRERQRRRLGRGKWMALVSACLHAARRYPVLSVALSVDGRPLHRRSSFVFIGNNEYKMAGFEIGERARIDAGQLSLYVTQRTGRFGLLRLALRALFRRLDQARDFDGLLATELRVETHRRFLHIATDGEVVLMRTPLEYRVRPRALRVIVPPS
jgi:diacylglycerol kinase family enzyme